MIIALTCELLGKIADTKLQFRQASEEIMETLQDLAKDICDRIEDEDEFKQFLDDTDFNNRSLLKIITEQKFERMLSVDNPMSQNVMSKIFVG